MRLVSSIQRIQRQRPSIGWALTLLGGVLLVLAPFAIALLFGARDFASNVRDDFEKAPGPVEYALFNLAVAFFVVVFVAGLLLIWARIRKHDIS
jgi:hypothetical protein